MTTTKANVNVKIDSSVKESAAGILSLMGIDITTAIDMFFRQVIAERRLPFQPIAQPSREEKLLAAIKAANIPVVELESDGNGHILVSEKLKSEHPETYDWLVNG